MLVYVVRGNVLLQCGPPREGLAAVAAGQLGQHLGGRFLRCGRHQLVLELLQLFSFLSVQVPAFVQLLTAGLFTFKKSQTKKTDLKPHNGQN